MDERLNFSRLQIAVTAIVTTIILSLLLWQHFHGGVPGHHVLQREDLPRISNWWGALLLPVLTWTLLNRIKTRTRKQALKSGSFTKYADILRLFIIGLTFGLALAISFANSFEIFLENALYIFLVLGLIVPLFYSEFILGFVLGMTYTLGAILPTVFALILATVGLLLFKLIRPLLVKLFRTVKNGNRPGRLNNKTAIQPEPPK